MPLLIKHAAKNYGSRDRLKFLEEMENFLKIRLKCSQDILLTIDKLSNISGNLEIILLSVHVNRYVPNSLIFEYKINDTDTLNYSYLIVFADDTWEKIIN